MLCSKTGSGWFACGLAVAMLGVAPHHARSSTPDRSPDISGTWERYAPEITDYDHPPPPGGPFELKGPYAGPYAALLKKKARADAAGAPLINTSARCLWEGMPTIMGATYPLQILQNPGQVTVLAEFLSQTRRIWLNDKLPPLQGLTPSYNGYSVGHWEGDTLVVETIGVRTDVLFFDVPHTEDMKITERFRHTGPDSLEDRIVIDDPKVLRQPYRFTFNYKKIDYRIMEYVCDNNQIAVDSKGGTSLKFDGARK